MNMIQPEEVMQTEKRMNINGYELQIELLRRQLIDKNVKILQMSTNRKQMLKQQISSCFESIEDYLKMILQKTQDVNLNQYIKRYLQFSKKLYYKRSWFICEKSTINAAVQTQTQIHVQLQQNQEDNNQLSQFVESKDQKIVSAFQLDNGLQQNYCQTSNMKCNQNSRSKTQPYLSLQVLEKDQHILQKKQRQEHNNSQTQRDEIKLKLQEQNKRLICQNINLKELVNNAFSQIKLLNSNHMNGNQDDPLKTHRVQENFKTHRLKYSQGNIKFQSYRNPVKQLSKNSQLISSDIYNLSETPLLSKSHNYRALETYKNQNEIKKYLFGANQLDQFSKKQLSELSMIMLCQASSIQKLLSCIQ